MSSPEKNYIIQDILKKSLLDFLENPFDDYMELVELIKSKNSFTENEINQIVSLLGKFPAFSVYPIIDLFRENLKIVEETNE